jgi:hypothetical protein
MSYIRHESLFTLQKYLSSGYQIFRLTCGSP